MPIDPHDYAAFLGSGLLRTYDRPAFQLGRFRLTRLEVAQKLGLPNLRAATILQQICQREGISTVTQLARVDPYSLAELKSMGVATFCIMLGVLQETEQLPKAAWMSNEEMQVTWATLKARVRRRRKEEHRAKRREAAAAKRKE
jgi:hypothetical protein